MKRLTVSLWFLLVLSAVMAGCGHITYGGTPPVGPTGTPSPTGSPTAMPSPGACATQGPANTTVFVAMASSIGAAVDATYGAIGGFAVVDSNGYGPPQAAVISHNTDGSLITDQNTLQFFNAEPAGSPVLHSAYGFKNVKAFPHRPYAFPSPLPSPTGTALTNGNWFTGRIASPADRLCFSQEFTLKPGTYYFGDYDLYNETTFRNVIVVSSSAALRTVGHRKHR